MQRTQRIEAIMRDFGILKKRMMSDSTGGLTPAKTAVLWSISCQGSCPSKDISTKLGMTPGAITQFVDGMVKDGLVTRTVDKSDRRKTDLALTAKGKRALAKAHKAHVVTFTALFSPLSDKELEHWHKTFAKIIDPLH